MIVIYTVYIFSQIFKKRELSENIYNAKIFTFTVYVYYPPEVRSEKYWGLGVFLLQTSLLSK